MGYAVSTSEIENFVEIGDLVEIIINGQKFEGNVYKNTNSKLNHVVVISLNAAIWEKKKQFLEIGTVLPKGNLVYVHRGLIY